MAARDWELDDVEIRFMALDSFRGRGQQPQIIYRVVSGNDGDALML
jgi:hypothetical protein